jgi:hypothetical protein
MADDRLVDVRNVAARARILEVIGTQSIRDLPRDASILEDKTPRPGRPTKRIHLELPIPPKSKKLKNALQSRQTTLNGPIAHIGLDTEYYSKNGTDGKPVNVILSYQLWHEELGKGLLVIPDPGERLSLKEICALSLSWVKKGIGSSPALLRLISHYFLAEFCSMDAKEDLKNWARNVQAVQKSFSSSTPDLCRLSDGRKHIAEEVAVTLHDTMLLSSSPLSDLGDSLGIPKVDIGDFIGRMNELLGKDFVLFSSYAITDAIICCKYFIAILNEARKITGEEDYVPITVSSIAARALIKNASDDEMAFLHPKETHKQTIHSAGKLIETKTNKMPDHVTFGGLRAYKGGRNETYLFGLYTDRHCYDYDIRSAYSTAMLCLDDVNWSDYEQVGDPDDIGPFDIGFADVSFRFRPGCNFPMFGVTPWDPVSQSYDKGLGICFPRTGKTVVTLTELWTARESLTLESLTIHNSMRFRRNGNHTLPNFVTGLLLQRGAERKGSVRERVLKLIINSLYGKITQGISQKKAIDLAETLQSGEKKKKRIPSSPVYNPMIAACITGIVRAAVGELLINLDDGGRGNDIVCCTTDGIMLLGDPMPREWMNGASLPLCSQLPQKRSHYLGEGQENILELKHHTTAGCASVRTRTYWMFPGQGSKGKDLLVARGGISTKGVDLKEVVSLLTSKFCLCDGCFARKRLTSLQEYISGEVKDMIRFEEPFLKNWDYDFKRLPTKPETFSYISGSNTWEKVRFSTQPWDKTSDFVTTRKSYAQWGRYANIKANRPNASKIQSVEDIKTFFEYADARQVRDTYAPNPENAIITKLIMVVGKYGLSGAETAALLARPRSFVNSRRRSKTYREYVAGKSPLRLPAFLQEKYDHLIQRELSKLPEENQAFVREEIQIGAESTVTAGTKAKAG